jgi:hypothetical protein
MGLAAGALGAVAELVKLVAAPAPQPALENAAGVVISCCDAAPRARRAD